MICVSSQMLRSVGMQSYLVVLLEALGTLALRCLGGGLAEGAS